MKRLFLNVICILVIGVGGLTLATASPANSWNVDSSAVIKVNAECETDSGDTCEGECCSASEDSCMAGPCDAIREL